MTPNSTARPSARYRLSRFAPARDRLRSVQPNLLSGALRTTLSSSGRTSDPNRSPAVGWRFDISIYYGKSRTLARYRNACTTYVSRRRSIQVQELQVERSHDANQLRGRILQLGVCCQEAAFEQGSEGHVFGVVGFRPAQPVRDTRGLIDQALWSTRTYPSRCQPLPGDACQLVGDLLAPAKLV